MRDKCFAQALRCVSTDCMGRRGGMVVARERSVGASANFALLTIGEAEHLFQCTEAVATLAQDLLWCAGCVEGVVEGRLLLQVFAVGGREALVGRSP
jgi:hypothetical protein